MINLYKKIREIKFVKDTILTMFSHFFVGISGLVINTIVGNHYHAEGLGLLNQALTIYMLLSLVSNLGIQTSVQKYASQYSGDLDALKNIFSAAVIATTSSGLVVFVIFYGSLIFYPIWLSSKELTQIVLVLIIAAPLFAINKTISNFLVGLRCMIVYANIRILRWVVIIASILYMHRNSHPLENIGFFFIFIESIILFYFIIIYHKYWGSIKKDWVITHLTFGVKSILGEFMSTFNTRTPILIIGYMLGNIAAGYFSYVESFARSVLMISSALQKNFNPIFTRLWYESKFDEVQQKMVKVFKYSLYSIGPLFLGLVTFFYFYTKMFMPIEYHGLYDILGVFLIGVGVMYIYSPFSTLLVMSGFLNINLLRITLFASVNIILTLLLVYYIGLIGAPIAFTLATFFNLFLLIVMYERKLNIPILKLFI